MKTVLIGGSHDGKRIEVSQYQDRICMPILRETRSREVGVMEISAIDEEVYHVEKISPRIWVAIVEGLGGRSVTDLLGLLARGYREQLS